MDQLERRPDDQVPAAGPHLGVNTGLPSRQADAARLDASARGCQSRHAAQRRRKVSQVGKTGTETNGVHRVDRLRVQTDNGVVVKTGVLRYPAQVELQLVAA